jgi:hypothetical protein|tara:strand:+ start:144 stop:530 length:387 start_codon:yes stop_codon:yes gene_type:complete
VRKNSDKLPGQFMTRFNVVVTEPSTKMARGIDGRPKSEWFESGSFEQSTTYNGVLTRLDRRWTLELQWVDLDNVGHRVVLPNKVVEAIRSGYERVIGQSNSAGARKAAQTRKDSGVIPFEPKHRRSGN